VGRNLEKDRETLTRLLPTSPQASASGADDAVAVSRTEPNTAMTMKTVPPRRYTDEIDAGSPIRRRIHSDCSSNT